MRGKCLCGDIQFEVQGKVPDLYQCHCSLCRKITGSSANAATLVHENSLTWLSGEEKITSFVDSTGYRSDFCSTCGSPVPNLLGKTDNYWIPAGLLEESDGFNVVVHIYTQSKARWEEICSTGVQYEEMPDLDTLFEMLHKSNR